MKVINLILHLYLLLLVSTAVTVNAQETQAFPIPAKGLLVLKDGVTDKRIISGHHSIAAKIPFTEHSPFRIASNTKPYVAATVFRLVEEGELSLDSPVETLLPENLTQFLIAAGYDTNKILLKHLISHTAGLRDHAMSKQYLGAVFSNPDYRWRPMEQIQLLSELGEPLNAPGEAFSYSDSGYVLLGQIIEHTTRLSLNRAVRHYLNFAGLGITNTWWEFYETPPEKSPARIHQYLEGNDTHAWHPSLDLYGGGGLVSTLMDTALFTEALLKGKVFKQTETLDLMLATAGLPAPQESRSGLLVSEFAGVTAIGHSGFWGTVSWYFPELDITVAGIVTEQSGYGSLKADIAELVKNYKSPPPS